MITIKNEYLDTKICCPATRKEIFVRFIPVEMYDFYFNRGYDFIFEEIIEEKQIKKEKK